MLIVINGMPRSGSTLLYKLISNYLETDIGAHTVGFVRDDDLAEFDVKFVKYALSSDVYIVKTHGLIPESLSKLRDGVIHFYTFRHPSRVLTSMMRVWGYDEKRGLDGVTKHARIALSMKDTERVTLLKFEDFVKNQKQTLRQSLISMGFTINPESILVAVNFANGRDFEGPSMFRQKASSKLKWINNHLKLGRFLKMVLPLHIVQRLRDRMLSIDTKTQQHPNHISRDGENQSDTDILNIDIEDKFKDWLIAFGYDASN